MELSKHIGPEQIFLSLKIENKWKLLELMAAAILKSDICSNQPEEIRNKILPAIIKREKEMSTGVGDGFALPHARIGGFSGFAVAIAVLSEEIDFESIDGKPVKIVCMIITPEENPTIALRILGAITTFMTDETAHYIFTHETNPKKFYDYIKEKKISLDISVTARDIMRKTFSHVKIDSTLKRATRTMYKERVEAIAVLDNKGNFCGEIVCDDLFKKGIPDFFNQLSSVSFIKHFDPFEKYFEAEASSMVPEIMTKNCATVKEDATLMEIIYLLSVKKFPKVYVLSDNKLCGTIDRSTVLDQIINL